MYEFDQMIWQFIWVAMRIYLDEWTRCRSKYSAIVHEKGIARAMLQPEACVNVQRLTCCKHVPSKGCDMTHMACVRFCRTSCGCRYRYHLLQDIWCMSTQLIAICKLLLNLLKGRSLQVSPSLESNCQHCCCVAAIDTCVLSLLNSMMGL